MTLRTVTLSPGFDHIVRVDHIEAGEVGRVLAWDTVAAGKGVNAARIATLLGVRCVAYSLVGEADHCEFADLLSRSGPDAVTVSVPGHTRRNLTLTIGSTPGLAGHAVGPRLEAAEDWHADQLLARLVDEVESGDVVSFNGAVPQPIRSEIWAEAAAAMHSRGAVVIADVQGDALRAVLRTRFVAMAKPNEDEARELTADGGLSDNGAARAGVTAMLAFDVADPIVSIGERGVIHVQEGSLVRSWCAVERPRIVVGAGDAFVAGYCAALEVPRWAALSPVHLGLASAAAHVSGARNEGFSSIVVENLAKVCQETISK